MPAPSGGAAARGFGPTAGARTSPPSAGQLPSRGSGSRHSNSWQGDHFTIGAAGGSGSVTTPGGITIGGAGGAVAIKGPGGNTVVRGGGAIGATNGINSVGRAGGFVGGVDRYGNTAIAGRGATFANGQFVGGHSWSAVNGNFKHWNCFHSGWYGRYPGAWFPGKWAARSVWATATWAALTGWWGYGGDPMYYDYGGDVGYSDGEIYYGDQPVATEEQYYNEATDIAAQGDQAAAADEEWLPLGVFGVVAAGQSNADKLFQLAVNKAGLIRGNYYDLLSDQVQPIEGAVDAKTQRAAWHAKAKPAVVVETGIYNLTNDEVPVLVHFGPNDTQQRTLIRLQNPEDQAKPTAPAAAAPADYHCTRLANDAGLLVGPWDEQSKHYSALLTVNYLDLADRTGLWDYAFHNVLGQQIASDRDELFSGVHDAPILTQTGQNLIGGSSPVLVWTGSTPSGEWSGHTADNWSNPFRTATVGNLNGAGTQWLSYQNLSSWQVARLYCISID